MPCSLLQGLLRRAVPAGIGGGVCFSLHARRRPCSARLEGERNAASEAMEFEQAAAIHQRMQKVQSVAHLASEAVHPLAQLAASWCSRRLSLTMSRCSPCAAECGVGRRSIPSWACGWRMSGRGPVLSLLIRLRWSLFPWRDAGHCRRKMCWRRGSRRRCRALAQSAPKSVSSQTLSDHRGAVHAMVLPACSALHGGDDLCWSGWRDGRASLCCALFPASPHELIARTRKSWPSRRSSGTLRRW